MNQLQLFLPCAAGVEDYLADEVHGLTGLAGDDLLTLRGGVRVRGDWPLVLRLSRKGMHLWYRGLAMVLKQTHWDLPEPLPEWLQAGMTPSALQALINRTLPPDPDGPGSGR